MNKLQLRYLYPNAVVPEILEEYD